jgi:glycosyltransferase involved in cell wall biosynthesis
VNHSPAARERIALETGVDPVVLTFPNYRTPEFTQITPQLRTDAKERLGFDPDRIHLTSLGFIDIRTKMSDLVIESAAWLQQWGHPVSLHLAGSGSEVEVEKLNAQAQRAGLVDFEITGFLSDEAFRDYLLATDIGIQLRISSLLGVSGPLADLAGFGVASVASSGLVQDIDAPSFVTAVPEYVSPVMVAQRVEQLLNNPIPDSKREELRLEYLKSHSPEKYAREFLSVLQDSVDANSAVD